jgi:6-pyruvoyltetrahydropterin/6-carboxytetrahydropterin synthase
MIQITRRERFCAAHVLRNEKWDDKKNMEVFGKCSNTNWHGHNFELFVTVEGEIEEETGYVMNLKILSEIMDRRVISKLDHKNINLEVDFMQGKMASTEVIAISIWGELEAEIKENGATLRCVKVVETENNFVEYFGR